MTTITGLDAYITCALWSSTDGDGTPLDSNHSDADIAPETIAKMRADWETFQFKAGSLLNGLDLTQVAHDFWLTRNHHGAGFWDGDYEKTTGELLTDLAHSFGECDLYVGDDGKLYAM